MIEIKIQIQEHQDSEHNGVKLNFQAAIVSDSVAEKVAAEVLIDGLKAIATSVLPAVLGADKSKTQISQMVQRLPGGLPK